MRSSEVNEVIRLLKRPVLLITTAFHFIMCIKNYKTESRLNLRNDIRHIAFTFIYKLQVCHVLDSIHIVHEHVIDLYKNTVNKTQ